MVTRMKFAQDDWHSNITEPVLGLVNDKIAHFLMWFLLGIGLHLIGVGMRSTLLIATLWGILFECLEVLNKHYKFMKWGQDDFSWRDVVADIAGVLSAIGIFSIK